MILARRPITTRITIVGCSGVALLTMHIILIPLVQLHNCAVVRIKRGLGAF